MTKAFKKGDKVTIISDWDKKGTCSYQDAIVHSCGKKQMVLTCAETGKELGHHFRPERDQYGRAAVFPRMTRDEAIAATLSFAKVIVENEIVQANNRLSQHTDERDEAFWRKYLQEIHEPRAAHIDELKRKVMESAS